MPNSQEQSLDENVIFQQVNVTSAEFLYSEKERQAVERLLSAGPEAFYNAVGNECAGCFLSSEEVSQISRWAQDFHFSHPQVPKEENGEEGSLQMRDFSSTYFPSHSDTPAPSLELGWPEKVPWMRTESIKVYTSPPAEGDPSVREIIRRHLQKASQVIAIVTDRLTDGTIISDLHSAAFRDVPVYIILNQRSIKENITLNRLRHPNIQVRVLGGKTFCSRTGRMVEGELKEKFLLVDLKTVIHGSYSLTWTDAHLHRQLITVLSGSVVDTFDKEFRILFAASQPVPDMWRVASTLGDVIFPQRDVSHYNPPPKIAQKHEIINPPSPPHDSLLDWEAMGVVCRQSFHESPFGGDDGTVSRKAPLQNDILVDKKKHKDVFTHNGQETPMDTWRRVESKMQQVTFRQLSEERSNTSDDKQTKYRFDDKRREPEQSPTLLSPTKQRERSRLEPVLLEETSVDGTDPKLENTPTSRVSLRSNN
ncbi:protein FAM83E-like [Lampetra planeri]